MESRAWRASSTDVMLVCARIASAIGPSPPGGSPSEPSSARGSTTDASSVAVRRCSCEAICRSRDSSVGMESWGTNRHPARSGSASHSHAAGRAADRVRQSAVVAPQPSGLNGSMACGTGSMAPSETVPSPGAWEPPSGTRPAWNWIPPDHGLRPRLDRIPRWVRAWYRVPFLDRFAHAWMWDHGGWDIVPHPQPGPMESGVREPQVPKPSRPTSHMMRELTDD